MNYVGICTNTRLSSYKIKKVLVPAGGLKPGNIVELSSLAASVPGVDLNTEVFTATQPATASLASMHFAMVVNGGLETLADGRKPAGQPDYTQYDFKENDVATVVLMDKDLDFEVSVDSVSGATTATPSADVGKYIIPANGTYVGAVDATPTAGNCLKIIGTRYMAIGGQFGGQFTPVYICRGEN